MYEHSWCRLGSGHPAAKIVISILPASQRLCKLSGRYTLELRAKGLAAEDVDHGLRSVFGDAMRIEVAAADEDDEDISADMRFGK